MPKQLLIIFVLLLNNFFTYAQMPSITVAGAAGKKVGLEKLKVDVKIVGNIAITTMEMEFCNKTNTVLEGELTFPMPEGVSINRFALDINGYMREAVPVEKEKGQVVFENTIRKKVDPALLEKVAGNNFKTRIYPLPANGCRRVILGYQEVLKTQNNSNSYILPLQSKTIIPNFNFNIAVYSKYEPEIGKACNTKIKFENNERKNLYTATTTLTDFKPNGTFQFDMPVLGSEEEVLVHKKEDKFYFVINHKPIFEVKQKAFPTAIHLIWDNSFSHQFSDIKKEIELVTSVMSTMKNGTITLSTIGYTFNKIKNYSVVNGINTELISALENMTYDGATNYERIVYEPNQTQLLIGDGLNTYSNQVAAIPTNTTLYCATASSSANFGQLKQMAQATGGDLLNLNSTPVANAIKICSTLPYRLIKVEHDNTVTEVYPQNTIAKGNVMVAGISTIAKNTLTLHYGYGNAVTSITKISIDTATQYCPDVDLSKLWAQQKIETLSINENLNKKAISDLGKQFNIVTDNTSLIVLDDVADYVKYEITPPPDLKAAYDSIIADKINASLATQTSLLNNALSTIEALKRWHLTDFTPYVNITVLDFETQKPLPNTVIKQGSVIYTTNAKGELQLNNIEEAKLIVIKNGYQSAEQLVNGYGFHSVTVYLKSNNYKAPVMLNKSYATFKKEAASNSITGKITTLNGEAIAFTSVRIKGTNNATAADADGYFKLALPTQKATIEFASVGYQGLEMVADKKGSYDIVLVPSGNQLEEVLVTGYGSRGNGIASEMDSSIQVRRSVTAASVQSFDADQIAATTQVNFEDALAAKVPGLTTNAKIYYASSNVSNLTAENYTWFDKNKELTDNTNGIAVNIKEITSNKPYIKTLEKTEETNYYVTYLSLRKEYLFTPQFYFDVAKFFFTKGKNEMALLVLSTIADLNLNDYELYKMLGYELKKQGDYQQALFAFKKVLDWRPQEPHSYRDYALALADVGLYQNAVDSLNECLTHNYDSDMMNAYTGMEETILLDINKIISTKKVNTKNIDTKLITELDVDVRVVLNWNMNDSDMDLWVTDPNNEKCYYSNKDTKIGGRISDDFTNGYGPEQFLLTKAKKGTYKVQLHYYGDSQQKIAGAATVMAEIYTNYGRPNEVRNIITLQMDKKEQREGILVGTFEF